MSAEKRFNLERQYRDHESPQARLAGRLKFACCRLCGSEDGMQSVRREVIARMDPYDVGRNRWYRGPDGDEYIFHQCWNCNWARIIPEGFTIMTLWEVLDWRDDTDSMAPDYAALAAKLRAWANELEAVSWYDATLVYKVAQHYYGPDSHPATLDVLRQLQEKYPGNELLTALAREEPVLASEMNRDSAGI